MSTQSREARPERVKLGRNRNATMSIHVRLEPEQYAAINQIADGENRTMGDVMREATGAYLKRRKRQAQR